MKYIAVILHRGVVNGSDVYLILVLVLELYVLVDMYTDYRLYCFI